MSTYRWAVRWTLTQGLLLSLLCAAAFAARAAAPQLAYAESSGCLLMQDGSVTCWGSGENGQTAPPAGPFDQISMGAWSGCGLRATGQVECWGGQGLSDPLGGFTDVPPGTYTQVDAGDDFHCALRNDQKVVCWGTEVGGEWIPYQGDTDRFVRVSTGRSTFCAIRTSGEMACNGFNPPPTPSGTYIDVYAGGDTYCALRSDHQLECWGEDRYGQTNPPPGPFLTAGLGAYHACGIRADGTLACWGYFGNQDYRQYFPPDGQYASLGVGFASNCALRTDGVVKCWGIDQAGEAPRFRIDPKVIEAAQTGVPYRTQLSMVDAGTAWTYQPYQPLAPLFMLSAGQLPPGFSVSADGVLEGTATEPGEWLVTLLGQDARGFEVERVVAFTVVNPGQDTTPPQISPKLTGTHEMGDWYRSDVTLDWLVEDPESGATTQAGCETTVVNVDTPITGTSFACSARSAGGVASETVEVRRDATPPTVQINTVEPQPDPGYYIAHYSAADRLSTVAFTECALDDQQSFAFCQPAAGDWQSHQFGPIDSGEHILYLRAADNAGNYSNTVSHVITGAPTDTTPPVIAPAVTGTLGLNGWYTSDISVSWSITDNESSISSSSGCDPVSVTTDTSGATFTCQATSAGGSSQQTLVVKRDTLAPDTTITGSPPNPSPFGPATFTFTGSDGLSGLGGFVCSIDGGGSAPCTSPHTVSSLAAGTHTFAVRANDNSGLADASPATYTWTMQAQGDIAPPVAHPTTTKAPNADGWFRTAVTVAWNWSDTGSGLNTKSCITKTSTSVDGRQTLRATCSDLAGNAGTATFAVNLDSTPPTLGQIVNSPLLLHADAVLAIQAYDALSGVRSSSCEMPTTGAVGTYFVKCTATDNAGNTASSRLSYKIYYRFGGYTDTTFAPYPTVNVLTTGTIVPMRFRLLDAAFAPVSGVSKLDTSTVFWGATCTGASHPVTQSISSAQLIDKGNGYYEMGYAVTKSQKGICAGLLPTLVQLDPAAPPPTIWIP